MPAVKQINHHMAMPQSPVISVVMAAYNASAFIHKAIENLKQQSYADWELIVVNDASTDNTEAVVRSLQQADSRIFYYSLPENKGPSAARNMGFSQAKGKYVTVLDADDRYDANRLKILLEKAEQQNADIIADNLACYDESTGTVVRQAFRLRADTIPLNAESFVKNDGPPRIASTGLLKPFIRREFWLASGIIYPEHIRVGEDFCFLFSLLLKTNNALMLAYAGYIYSLPHGTTNKNESSTTRTDYTLNGINALANTNDYLITSNQLDAKTALKIYGLLAQRKQRFLREITWRKMKLALKGKQPVPLLRLFLSMNMLPYFSALYRKKVIKLDTVMT